MGGVERVREADGLVGEAEIIFALKGGVKRACECRWASRRKAK